MGWQDLHPQVRRAYQSKGGSVRKPKGFALMDENRHLEVSSLGGKNKSENTSNKGNNVSQKSDSVEPYTLEELLRVLEDINELQE